LERRNSQKPQSGLYFPSENLKWKPEGGLLYWGMCKICERKTLEMVIILHRGSNGEPGGRFFYRGLCRQ
jgi:hypothetical protein